MQSLLINSQEPKWYPRSIDSYRNSIIVSTDFHEYKSCKSNFAYNMQYIEYIEKQLKELRLTDVLKKMLYKSYILTGMSIIELLFSCYLKGAKLWPTSDWKDISKATTNEMTYDGQRIKLETTIYRKVDKYPKQINLDSMIKILENRKF